MKVYDIDTEHFGDNGGQAIKGGNSFIKKMILLRDFNKWKKQKADEIWQRLDKVAFDMPVKMVNLKVAKLIVREVLEGKE